MALDYQTGLATPRVIASDYTAGLLQYREIAARFDALVDLLGL